MAGIGIVLAWFGYAVSYYGLNTLTGGNESFMSLIWPGRYVPVNRDSPVNTAATAPGASGSANPTPQAAAGAQTYGLAPGQVNTTDPNKPIFIAPSGQPVSGTVGP
mgnify:FL=1